MDARDAVGLIADETRLRVVAAVALGASTLDAITAATGLGPRDAGRAVARLLSGGLVIAGPEGYGIDHEALADAARAGDLKGDPGDHSDRHPEDARVLRSFFRAGRLKSIPVQRVKRLVVLDELSQAFEPGARYPEKTVNTILNRFHPDHAALRRHLVDEGFLERGGGRYWRAGGTFDVDD